jgi:nuclear pore complex protein Nup98-Nup96
LWGLLKLYASTQSSSMKVNLGEVLTTENLTGNPINARLCFQLYQGLRAKGIADFAGNAPTTSFSSDDDNGSTDEQDDHGSDMLASLLVAQLSSTSTNLVQAVFAAAHLRDATSRASTIRALLTRHASALHNDTIFGTLTQSLRIPEAWVHTSLAQHARSVLGDATAEINHLLRASKLAEAHTRLRTAVAPRMVIEEDVDGLRELLAECDRFDVSQVQGWNEGGGLYADFVELDRKISTGEEEGKDGLVVRLETTLEMGGSGNMALEERVARAEIRRLVGEQRTKKGNAARKVEGGKMEGELMNRAMQLSESFYARVGGIRVGA